MRGPVGIWRCKTQTQQQTKSRGRNGRGGGEDEGRVGDGETTGGGQDAQGDMRRGEN